MNDSNSKEPYFCGYTVKSTAKLNVEDPSHNSQGIWTIQCLPYKPNDSKKQPNKPDIQDIAKKLNNNGKKSELIIAVHGYAQGEKEEPFWHKGIFDYFSKDTSSLEKDKDKNYVFLGYCWPSEKPLLGKNLVSMPGTILGFLLFSGFFILSFFIILLVSEQKNQSVIPKDSDVYFLWGVVFFYIFLSWISLSHRHQHNNKCIESLIDVFLLVLFGGLLFGFLHILHSQYNHYFLLLIISIFISVLLLLLILKCSKAFDLLAPTLPVSLCIVIAFEFLLIQPFEPILKLFKPILEFFEPILKLFKPILEFFKPILEFFKPIPEFFKLILEFLLDRLGTSLIIAIATFVIGIIVALISLRSVAYFRDSYRANHFGVPDLVELIKQLDKAIEVEKKQSEPDNNRVKLSFIGHSMGCFVITNTIRILSDVFDSNSLDENPNSNIGKSFNLERLILVAPDIPVQTIITGRANFLRASLHRVKEAYIFSNEGDIVLRILSATANYFSFPTNDRIRGSRLGILTVSNDYPDGKNSDRDRIINKNTNKREPDAYGIVNYVNNEVKLPSGYLEIRDSSNNSLKLSEKCEQNQVADLFTYFDCTDYIDCIDNPNFQGIKFPVVSEAIGKPKLGIWEYARLSVINLPFLNIEKIPFLKCRKIDVHSDYFKGVFIKRAIYEIAFLGLKGFLTKLANDSGNKDVNKDLLEPFGEMCQGKQIRVVISPKHLALLSSGHLNNESETSAPISRHSQ